MGTGWVNPIKRHKPAQATARPRCEPARSPTDPPQRHAYGRHQSERAREGVRKQPDRRVSTAAPRGRTAGESSQRREPKPAAHEADVCEHDDG